MSDTTSTTKISDDCALVSVVMPLYNAESTVKGSISSVLNQTYEKLELIVVDDCSADEGPSIVSDIAKFDSRVQLIKLTKNSGAGVARNAAIEAANGEYIAFLDADDQWFESKIATQLAAFRERNVALVCSGYEVVNTEYQTLGSRQPVEWISYKTLLKANIIGCLTAIYDVKQLGKVYMPSIRKRQDYALWLDILKRQAPAYCVQEKLAKYYIQPNSISANKIEMLKWNYLMFRQTQKFSPVLAARLTLGNAVRKLLGK